MTEDSAQPLLTPAEVAQLFRVHPKTVTRWATTGQLRSLQPPGGHRRFCEADVLALLAELPSRPSRNADPTGVAAKASG